MKNYTLSERSAFFETLEQRVSSAGLALYDDTGRVLVVKANYKRYWSFPGGIIDAGETPRQAAIRETSEEVGVTIDDASLHFCMVVNRVSRVAQTYQFIFDQQVDASLFDAIQLDTDEIDEYALVSREDIIAGDKVYSASVLEWARGFTGYLEQQFSGKGVPPEA